MINWFIVKYLSAKDSSDIHLLSSSDIHLLSKTTYQALLSSFVADIAIVKDWMYFRKIFRNHEDIPQSTLILQLISCFLGTLAWLSVVTEGGFVCWVRAAFVGTILIPLYIIHCIIRCIILRAIRILHIIARRKTFCCSQVISPNHPCILEWINGDVIGPLEWCSAKYNPPSPSVASCSLGFFLRTYHSSSWHSSLISDLIIQQAGYLKKQQCSV